MKVYDYYIWRWFWNNIHEWSWLLAESEEEAMIILAEEFWLQWKLQWKPVAWNLKKEMYRLSLYEKWNIEQYIQDRTKKHSCSECNRIFRKMTNKNYIDPYEENDYVREENRKIYCSFDCAVKARWIEAIDSQYFSWDHWVIYKITKKSTGQCYIGQTIRSWTLRWWEHFTQWTSPKFQEAINSTPLEDWTFEILEKVPKDIVKHNKNYLTDLEAKWIAHFNSVEVWFNTRLEKVKER